MISLYSKSSVGVDNNCHRSYWLAYEELGTGLRTSGTGLELHLGTALHDALACIATRQQAGETIDIDEIAIVAYKQVSEGITGDNPDEVKIALAMEQGTLVQGLIYGFHKHVWTRLMANHTIKAIELPVLYRHDGKAMMTKGDLVLESSNGLISYLEYKSTSSKKEEWIGSWRVNPQIHTTIAALRQQHSLEVDFATVQGLYKGFPMSGKQTSIFCYAYKKSGNPPFTRESISYEWKAGSRKVPVWELEGGVKTWVENMPEEILAEQFPQTPPIYWNEEIAEKFTTQQGHRQEEIKRAKEHITNFPDSKELILDQCFPQNFEKCYPSFGRECAYTSICHGNAGDDPLSHGYSQRTTDHLEIFTNLLTDDEMNS